MSNNSETFITPAPPIYYLDLSKQIINVDIDQTIIADAIKIANQYCSMSTVPSDNEPKYSYNQLETAIMQSLAVGLCVGLYVGIKSTRKSSYP